MQSNNLVFCSFLLHITSLTVCLLGVCLTVFVVCTGFWAGGIPVKKGWVSPLCSSGAQDPHLHAGLKVGKEGTVTEEAPGDVSAHRHCTGDDSSPGALLFLSETW